MKPTFYRKVLKNGMTVLLEKRNLPVVSVAFAVRAGGINETEEERGISHFIEHMLYKGTKKRNAQQIAEEIEKNGGELNGFTEEWITAYWCKMPSKNLNIALEVLSDMVKNPLFDEKEMEKERKVIFEEIKMRKDTPRIHVYDTIQCYLYNGILSTMLIGTEKSLLGINREKMLKKFKQIYTPDNMILCVVGDADIDEVANFAEKNFSAVKGSVPGFDIILNNKQKIEKRKGIDQANLIFAYHAPFAGDKKHYAALALNTILAGGMSSRLFGEIREKRNLAYAVKGETNITKDYSYNLIYVGTTKENVEKVKEIILQEFEKVSEGLTQKEINQVKEQLIGNYDISMEDSQLQMVGLLASEINGDAREFYEFEKNIKEVKLEDVKGLAKLKDYSFYALVPEE